MESNTKQTWSKLHKSKHWSQTQKTQRIYYGIKWFYPNLHQKIECFKELSYGIKNTLSSVKTISAWSLPKVFHNTAVISMATSPGEAFMIHAPILTKENFSHIDCSLASREAFITSWFKRSFHAHFIGLVSRESFMTAIVIFVQKNLSYWTM